MASLEFCNFDYLFLSKFVTIDKSNNVSITALCERLIMPPHLQLNLSDSGFFRQDIVCFYSTPP